MTARIGTLLVVIAVAVSTGCGSRETTSESAVAVDAEGEAVVVESYLPTPFTADQIRAEWVEGFELIMRRSSPDGEALERWRVVAADDEGVEIEFAPIDAMGQQVGEPRRQKSAWEELRDHARFPSDRASREWQTQVTPLGELEGWMYRVDESDDGTESFFFFAESLPGAPVQLRVVRDGQVVLDLAQLERYRPADPDLG